MVLAIEEEKAVPYLASKTSRQKCCDKNVAIKMSRQKYRVKNVASEMSLVIDVPRTNELTDNIKQ